MMHWNTFSLKTDYNQQNFYKKFNFYSNWISDSKLFEHVLTMHIQENCCHPDLLCKGDGGGWKSVTHSY